MDRFRGGGPGRGRGPHPQQVPFTNLDRFNGAWTISRDGETVERGPLARLDLAPERPGGQLPVRGIVLQARRGVLLAVHVHWPRTTWAKAGYEIATAQFKLPGETLVPRLVRPA